jgi:MFS family permease
MSVASMSVSPVVGHAHAGRYAWYVVLLLTAAQMASFTDRYLPSLLIEPLKADFQLSDYEVGLLLGPAFALFYATVGLPIGWLADRWSRRSILCAGITIWCCMTVASSVVASFIPLLCLRLGVGLGEATMSPCAISLISDYFPRSRRPRAMGVYMTGSGLGAGTAFLFVGPLVHWLSSRQPLDLGHFGVIPPWQSAFAVIGLPGLLIAALMFTVKEPPRTEVQVLNRDSHKVPAFKEVARYILARWRGFGTLFLGSACLSTLSTLNVWNVSLFQRTWNWNVADVGMAVGILFFTAVPLGTVAVVWLTNRNATIARGDASLRSLIVGLAIAVPGFAGYALMPNAPAAIGLLFVAFIGQAIVSAAAPVALTLITPGQIRSQTVAIFYLIISLVSLMIGPPPVGWLVDYMGDPHALRYAISLEATVIGVPSLIIITLGLKHYAKAVIPLPSVPGGATETRAA